MVQYDNFVHSSLAITHPIVGAHDDQDVHDDHDDVPADEEPEGPAEADDDDEHDVQDVPHQVHAAPDHHPLFHVLVG